MACPPEGDLFAIFAGIANPCGRMGRRHNLPTMLAGITCGTLAKARSLSAITQWKHDQAPGFWHQPGFLRKPPCTNGFRFLRLKLPAEVLESAISEWTTTLVGNSCENAFETVVIDGKTLRGAMQQHGKTIQLLAALGYATGSVLKQSQMPSNTNEHKAAMTMLRSMVLRDKVITGHAMFCQRDLCQQIVDAEGDYLFTVKDNQRDLKAAIEADFTPGFPPGTEAKHQQQLDTHSELSQAHGRVETRTIEASSRLAGHYHWPGVAQVCRIEQTVKPIASGKVSSEISYAVTSLSPHQATAQRPAEILAALGSRKPFALGRYVVFAEDASQARRGHVPENTAPLRNAANSAIRFDSIRYRQRNHSQLKALLTESKRYHQNDTLINSLRSPAKSPEEP